MRTTARAQAGSTQRWSRVTWEAGPSSPRALPGSTVSGQTPDPPLARIQATHPAGGQAGPRSSPSSQACVHSPPQLGPQLLSRHGLEQPRPRRQCYALARQQDRGSPSFGGWWAPWTGKGGRPYSTDLYRTFQKPTSRSRACCPSPSLTLPTTTRSTLWTN